MERFGIRYHALHSGKYKASTSGFSAPLSVSQKETIRGSLENVMAQLKSDIHQSRNHALVQNIYDGRIMSAQTAKDLGLIDHIGFWRNMVDIITNDVTGSDVVLASLDDFKEAPSDNYHWRPFNKIAVVEINGPITSGKNRSDALFGGVQTGSDDIARTFDRLSKDPFLQGVIIRINSPGGSVIAADQILDAVNQFKKISKKPVYASMGTFAASGGYYVALGSDQIFANGATITGSIGVMSGFLNFSEFNKEWGISSERLSTGKYMDAFSPNKSFDDDTKAMILSHQQASYQHFKSLVQESRQLTDDEVNAVSQGQFMTGEEAKTIGLVDELGSYTDTIEAMEKSLGLKQSRVVVYGRPKMISPFNVLNFLFDQ
jgi:protease-4